MKTNGHKDRPCPVTAAALEEMLAAYGWKTDPTTCGVCSAG